MAREVIQLAWAATSRAMTDESWQCLSFGDGGDGGVESRLVHVFGVVLVCEHIAVSVSRERDCNCHV